MLDEVRNVLNGEPYHVGIVVEDVGAAMEEYGALFGVQWGQRRKAEFPVELRGTRRTLRFDSVFATSGPVRVELTVQKPDTFWRAGGGMHHLGFWSDDPMADSRRLTAAGYEEEARLFPFPDDPVASVAFHRGPQGIFVELVSSTMRAGSEAGWSAPA
ncbi:VOC family protein [Trujillonella endophytica]|uniref:Glyoxalase/Bleomycin resistance protein/Dioxygenase superfamily protein n=1 Tax=Trujillonella endophytica TaxID=673521 RepID=A0A1H8QQF1_9ACTN|nr:VOC family protein [Trujillella endophytica]SEO56197.1 Glyoxalase/Bleomycin resistance protein/Dioxygenase superfamily protein [Trujillella endophytica]